MSEWIKNHPIATHILNTIVNVIIALLIVFFTLTYIEKKYGDKIRSIYKNTNTIKEILENGR